MTGLTPRMVQCLDAIRELTLDGVPPTVRELANHLGIASSSQVQELLCALRDRRVIGWTPRRARSLYIIEDQVSPAVLNALSDEALRRAAAHIAGILASRGGGVSSSERIPEHRHAAAPAREGMTCEFSR